ncbi:MAG: hypothetical protein HRT44_07180 [Bdellovibrionales bacterium]|nr:hypothetical protein [Bdellovibrionales bacterium]NQZ19019.1 hypothetical protein [Bdellovibrionales bacterium]
MRIFLHAVIIVFLVSCGIDKEPAPPISSIAGGDLDTTFGTEGFYTHHNAANGSSNDEAFAMTADQGGRLIIVGTSVNGDGDTDMAVWRLNSEGQPDTGFATQGVFVHDNAAGGDGNDAGYGVVVDSSNSIYVTGYSVNAGGNFDMVVWKLTSDGTLDPAFGAGGIFIDDGAAGGGIHDQGNDIIFSQDSALLITGYSDQTASNRDLAIWKVNPSTGALDTSFDTDGIVTVDGTNTGEDEIGNAITRRGTAIYVTGRAESATNSADMAVWKFDLNGAPDGTFNSGSFTHNNAAGGNAFDVGTDITTDEVGEVIISGYSRNASNNNDMVVWKVKTDGTLATSFGNNDGYYLFNIVEAVGTSTADTGDFVSMDASGNILVAGAGNNDVAAWRLTPEGTLDDSFNGDGSFFHDSAAGGFATDAGVCGYYDAEEDRLHICGYSENASGNFDMAVWRLD